MGWQTFCKLAENAYNNLPFGFSYGRDQDNTELLRILTPNMLRVGRINSRALQGPIKLPVNRQELLGHVDKLYSGWFKIFKDTVVPRLISQPKWFKVEKDLQEGDFVYFKKDDSALGSSWTIGRVDQIVVGRDGFIRRAVIKYHTVSDRDPSVASQQFTDRAVRSLVKLWSVDEVDLFDDLSELGRNITTSGVNVNVGGCIVVAPVGWPMPLFQLSDKEKICLGQFSTSCKMSCRFTEWNCQDDWSKLDGVADNLDTSSFEKLILSTGFSLD